MKDNPPAIFHFIDYSLTVVVSKHFVYLLFQYWFVVIQKGFTNIYVIYTNKNVNIYIFLNNKQKLY